GEEKESEAKKTQEPFSDAEAVALLKRITEGMEKDKLYTDSSLTVRKLAKQLSLTQRDVSRVINERLNKNFNDFLNHYRVEETKKLLTDSKNKEIQILDIAFQVGFNSKSSFNSVFKKFTGLSPSQYRAKYNR
ncbi:MAG: AraC family transcriptional regulator, partial [bacterium]|nr:AraC family transcriptional regulator [bacterium]